MSTKVVEAPVATADSPARPDTATACDRLGYASLGAVAPTLMAVIALVVDKFIPSRQSTVPTSIYPELLKVVLAASFLIAAVQWAWRPLRPWVGAHAPLWAGSVALMCVWDLVTLKFAWLPLPYFPGPDAVLCALMDDWEVLLDSTLHSLALLSAGYLSGVVAGLVTGVLIGWFPHVRYWGMPVLKVIGPIPATALVPLVMTLFAESFTSAAALIGFAVWFPVTMLTASGISNVRLSYLDVARTLGAGRLYLILRVAIPAALPNIFIGLFMGLGASFLTLVVAETLGVKAGLGWYLKWRQGYMEYDKVYASLLIMAVFFSTLMTLLFRARDKILRWQKGVIKW